MLEARQTNRNASRLNQEIIDRSVTQIRQRDAIQCAWRQLGPINTDAAAIRRAEAETFFGLSLAA